MQNEVVFNNKISLKKYMKGILFNIDMMFKDNIRNDLIYNHSLDEYLKKMKEVGSWYSNEELEQKYKINHKKLSKINNYDIERIVFRYN